ncbi:hypothetical protein C8J57DRAFT_1242961 [Mycena rebaudengoi]|nr:hypothetical protein C8J57DRAFT_1242961 [Mycena rebaudengoi]
MPSSLPSCVPPSLPLVFLLSLSRPLFSSLPPLMPTLTLLPPAPDLPLDMPIYLAACSGVSNATLGKILPPVMSARVNTRRSASIKFCRVEIRAKLPTGDWLCPALWMLPVDDAYGGWPLSGEIDIMEARGNGPRIRDTRVLKVDVLPPLGMRTSPLAATMARSGGITSISSGEWMGGAWCSSRRRPGLPPAAGDDGAGRGHRARLVPGQVDGLGAVLLVVVIVLSLNWGPTTFLNAVALTFGSWPWHRGQFEDGRAYVDTRLHHMLEIKLNKPFWERDEFPNVVQNGTGSIILENPWVNGTKAAPFDQSFYLIMNVAVGGTNGWFPDVNRLKIAP